MSTPTTTTDDPAPQQPGGRASVLRHRSFALLFAGQAISLLGDRLVLVATPFAVLALPGGGLSDVGVVLGANALGFGLLVLIGGVVADRVPRQLTMLASDLVRGLAQAVSAGLLLTGNATVTSLALLQLLYGGAEAFFRPAVLGLVPQVTDPGEEQPANALLALSNNVSMVVGPAVAGLLVAWLGAGGALAIDAGTFVVSAITLAFLRPRPYTPAPSAPLREQVAGGWREVRNRSWVWAALVAFAAYHAMVLPAIFVLGPKVANDIRDGAASWGVISAGFGAGAVIGSVVALRWRPRRPGLVLGLMLCVGALQGAICASPLPTLAVALLEAGAGVGVALCFTLWETALQQRIPVEAQSRVSSFDYLASVTLMPVGYALIGPAADGLGIRITSVGATVVTLAVAVAVLPVLTRLPAVPEVARPVR
ncbi:MAG TPA: MFS transporter [Mycobacteriales bacterium]|nr:MFS transporter [Mycobacteriales bacterium]